jgi:dTDP-4-dehydrorhamnose reductase
MTRVTLDIWAGLECTLNRVGEAQHDQLARSGHYERLDDIDRIAGLGVRTVRYPVLWERHEGREPDDVRWRITDARLARLRELGVQPIVGLLHHGSGPLDTSLLDDAFPERFAAFAALVAARYPWVDRFTPINEPLTTARFSALYGIWHPHVREDGAFLRALLNQVRATRLAMAAIRRITPGAALVQTEDLGYTHATPRLARQAEFENERRWLSYDLLCGRVTPRHPLWPWLTRAGVGRGEVARAVGDGCVPDLLGINHYVTSERWLDERLARYPAASHGGNRRLRYADVEAVRALPDGVLGPATLLGQAWRRFGIPIAVTEVHLGCTREQQLRWLRDVWEGAAGARDAGAEVRAVTAWAALGAFDWCSLVTRTDGVYEPGLFDVRSTPPRPTALAAMTRALATEGRHEHPALHGEGWWRDQSRLLYDTGAPARARSSAVGAAEPVPARPVLVAGAAGTLGQAFVRACDARGLRCVPLDRAALDVTSAPAVARALDETGAWAVVNAAGFVRVDDAEWNAEECRRANVHGPATLARACAARGVQLATFSSDLVFDGRKGTPYVEGDATAPLGVYGTSKRDAEDAVLREAPRALVVRTAWFFGPRDPWNFVTRTLQGIASGAPVQLPDDLVVSPTWVPHLVDATLDLLVDGECGLWHLASAGEGGTVADIARAAAALAGLDGTLVHGRPHRELGLAAPRPPAVVLASERGGVMPPLGRALAEYVESRAWITRARSSSVGRHGGAVTAV